MSAGNDDINNGKLQSGKSRVLTWDPQKYKLWCEAVFSLDNRKKYT